MLVAASAENAITEDPLDVQIRKAFSPAVNVLLAALERTPITANALAAVVGEGTPLVRSDWKQRVQQIAGSGCI